MKNPNTSTLRSLGSEKTEYHLDAVKPEVLETFENTRGQLHSSLMLVPFVMPEIEFTSLCPKTKQPDFARIEIVYVPADKMVESKSLKLYLFSYRNHGAFHESCVSQIADDLWKLLDPHYLRVVGDFTPRGGIAIKPIVQRFQEGVEESFKNVCLSMVAQFDRKGLGL